MRNILLFIFCLTSFSYFGQSKIDFFKSNGYVVVNDINPFSDWKKDRIRLVTEKQLNSCFQGDVFNYFNELRHFDTELKQKLYREDNKVQYMFYLDSLEKLRDFYKTSYEYVSVKYSKLSNYDVATKKFLFVQKFNSLGVEDKAYKMLKSISNGNQSFSNFSFYPLNDIVQRASISNPKELFGIKFVDGQLRTEIKIHDERNALKLENNSSLEILIMFNRFDTKNDIHSARKVLFFIDDQIIQAYGKDSEINYLLEKATMIDFKSGGNSGVSDPFAQASSGKSASSKGNYKLTERIRISDITSKPKTPNNESVKIALELIINPEGRVVLVNSIRSGTTTTNKELINEVMELVKSELRYEKSQSDLYDKVFVTVNVSPN